MSWHRERQQLMDAAAKIRENNLFVGYYITRYMNKKGIAHWDLIDRFRCQGHKFFTLYICVCPNPEEKNFDQRIKKIARFIGVSEPLLNSIIRESFQIESDRVNLFKKKIMATKEKETECLPLKKDTVETKKKMKYEKPKKDSGGGFTGDSAKAGRHGNVHFD
jgi:hypothetical protein